MSKKATIHQKKYDIDPDATPDEILSRAKEEGIELSDEQLEEIAGGYWGSKSFPSEITQWITCNTCNGREILVTPEDLQQGFTICPGCGTKYVL